MPASLGHTLGFGLGLTLALAHASSAVAQAPPVAPPPTNLASALPRDWSPAYLPDRVILTPPGFHLFHTCALVVMAGEEHAGEFRAWFDRKLEQGREGRAVTVQGELVSGRSPEGYEFLHTTTQLADPGGRRARLFLYAARAGNRGEPVAFFSDDDGHFETFLPAVHQFTGQLRYAEPPIPQESPIAPPVADPAPAPRPGAVAGAVRVESMYWKLVSAFRGTTDHLTFYSNGRVTRETSTEGPLTVDLAQAATYMLDGDQVRISWRDGETTSYRREADGLVTGDGRREWKRLPSVDGLRFQGTYTYGGDDGPWITFGTDGAFQDTGVLRLASFYLLTNAPEPPPGGSGRYEIRDYTLTLTYSGGASWRMTFYVMPGDEVRRPERFVINQYLFALKQP